MRVLGAPALARAFTLDLDELWESGHGRAHGPGRSRGRSTSTAAIEVRPWFTPGVRRRALAPGREVPRPGAARGSGSPRPVLTSGPILAHARRGRERAPLRRRRRDRRDAGRRGVPPVGDERRQRLEDPAPRTRCSTAAPFSGKPSTPWTPESRARLHAREGRRRGRRRLRRLVQLLPLGRAERRERARDPRRRRSPTGSRRSSTRCGRATRATTPPRDRGIERRPPGCRDT